VPFREAVHLLLPVVQAIDYAIRARIIHRDLKPGNILLSSATAPLGDCVAKLPTSALPNNSIRPAT